MKIQLKPIDQQVVVLFGATSGIGLETALRMVERGARVALIGRDQEGLDIAVDRVREHFRIQQLAMLRDQNNGGSMPAIENQVIGITADASQWDQVKNAADQVMASFGRIDTWVHLAGVSEWALFEDTSPDEFRRIVDVNLVGQAYGAMAALPYMKQQDRGALIFISSVAGRIPLPYQAAYVASKHGILGMAESLRLEMMHNQVPISVTTILPSTINTPLFSKARTKLGVEPAPMPPVYDARVVADAILFAATHPVREVIAGGSGYMFQKISRYSKPAANALMRIVGFKLQKSDTPKSAQEPDNLYHHIEGYNQVEGEYLPQTKRVSMYTWLQTHPVLRLVMTLALIGGGAYLVSRLLGRRKKQTFMRKVGRQLSSVKMPSVRREKTISQKVARQASKARKRLPFYQKSAWYETLPLLGLLPFLKKKSRFERVKDQVGSKVTSVGKSAGDKLRRQTRNLEHVSDRVQKAAEVPARKVGELAARVKPEKAVREVSEMAGDAFVAVQNEKTVLEKVADRLPALPKKADVVDTVKEHIPAVHRKDKPVIKLPF